jgi:hypothetical protein
LRRWHLLVLLWFRHVIHGANTTCVRDYPSGVNSAEAWNGLPGGRLADLTRRQNGGPRWATGVGAVSLPVIEERTFGQCPAGSTSTDSCGPPSPFLLRVEIPESYRAGTVTSNSISPPLCPMTFHPAVR